MARTKNEGFEQLLEKGCDALARQEYADAEGFLKKALSYNPENSMANHFTGLVLALTMRPHQALPFLEKAVEADPDTIQFRYNLATTLYQLRRFEEACSHFELLLRAKPDHVGALINLGAVYTILGFPSKAETLLEQAIKISPDQGMLYINLGNAREDQGRVKDAIIAYDQAIALEPANESAHSNKLLALCYLPDLTNEQRFETHAAWEKHVGRGLQKTFSRPSEKNDTSAIRIGYMSSDFRRHSVAYFLEGILKNHSRSDFNIFCYSDVAAPDVVTQRLRSYAFGWRNIAGASHEAVAQMVAGDRIDILVDLSGHSAQNRLGVFLMKPAPVQVTYLGYPSTTGLSTIDYRITDEASDPSGLERYHSEKLFRLSPSFLCYTPPEQVPEISALPREKNGFMTFGSMNNLPKITDQVVETWARILQAIPLSRMVIKNRQNNDPAVRQRMVDRFAAYGIESSRLLLAGHVNGIKEHLSWYNRIDLALDTFPYNGTTTTFESLLMGVPVISLRGDHHAARVGYSILSTVGLRALVAGSCDEYTATARYLSEDTRRLAALRQSLRTALLQSPLCDARSFTQRLEQAYRHMMKSVCFPDKHV